MVQKVLIFLLLFVSTLTPSAFADTHGYGQGFCGNGSICYTGNVNGDTLKPGSQCGNLSDWKYGTDGKNPPGVPHCWTGFCCDPNQNPPTPTPDQGTVKTQGLPPGCTATSSGGCSQVETAIGTIPTDPSGLVQTIFRILLGLSGGVAMLLIIAAGYEMMTSQGNPEKVKGARERLTSAIVGLLFIIFSLAILQIIGVEILQIPGFK